MQQGGSQHKSWLGPEYAGVTEAEARAALRAFVGVGDIEPWIAGRPWQAVPGGWTVAGELQGWRFRLEAMAGGVRVIASTPGGGEPAVWFVPGR
jgi:hypothetical protein